MLESLRFLEGFMAVSYGTRDFKKGLKIQLGEEPWVILEFQHVSPGKGHAFTKIKVRNLKNQKVVEYNIKSGERVLKPDLEQKKASFMYHADGSFYFMDSDNYEEIQLSQEDVGEQANFLVDQAQVRLLYFEGRCIGLEMEQQVIALRVVETDPGVKGDTATGGSKLAKLETGLSLLVPLHIEEGDLVRVNSRTYEYLERDKSPS